MTIIYSKNHPERNKVVETIDDALAEIDDELPFGMHIQLRARCRNCGNRYDYDGDIANWDERYNLCGGSPRCIP